MEELLLELETIRNQLLDFPLNANGRTYRGLILDLTTVIEKLKTFNTGEDNIPEVLAPEDLPDDEDL